MRFPEAEASIATLSLKVANGLTEFPKDFPNPPFAPAMLLAKRDEFIRLMSDIATAESTLRQLHVQKDRVIQELKDFTKADLSYGEIQARHAPEKLTALGWGPPRARVPLVAPGEVRGITVGAQGETTVELSWLRPVDGGKVASYEIQRRTAGGKWEGAGTMVGLRTRLEGQPRGVQLVYRVVGVNAAGQGAPSGEVSVVL